MFYTLGIPVYYYLIAVGIGVVVGKWKDWNTGLLAAYLFFLLAETVLIRRPGILRYKLIPFWSWSRADLRTQIYTNILMFIPVGLLVGKRGWKGLLFAAGCSMVIELLQLVSRRGLFEFDDVIHNTLGAGIGLGLWAVVRKSWKKIRKA